MDGLSIEGALASTGAGGTDAGDLGEVQRCDTCALFPTDEDAQDAARFTGLLVDLEGKVLPEPEGLFPYIERNQTMIALLRARIADVRRLLGTAEGARFYVLADRSQVRRPSRPRPFGVGCAEP